MEGGIIDLADSIVFPADRSLEELDRGDDGGEEFPVKADAGTTCLEDHRVSDERLSSGRPLGEVGDD